MLWKEIILKISKILGVSRAVHLTLSWDSLEFYKLLRWIMGMVECLWFFCQPKVGVAPLLMGRLVSIPCLLWEVGACALGLAKQQLPVPQQRSVFALFWFALIVFLCCSISDCLQWVIMLSYQLLCFAGFHLPFRFLSYSVQCVWSLICS